MSCQPGRCQKFGHGPKPAAQKKCVAALAPCDKAAVLWIKRMGHICISVGESKRRRK